MESGRAEAAERKGTEQLHQGIVRGLHERENRKRGFGFFLLYW